MVFRDGELSVVDGPVASDDRSEKNGLTPQDQIDMAEMGKKQQFRVRPLLRERFCDMLAQFCLLTGCQRNFGFMSMLGKLSKPLRRIINYSNQCESIGFTTTMMCTWEAVFLYDSFHFISGLV